jgi:hypothetical protein
MKMKSVLCLRGLLLLLRHETQRKLIGSFIDATFTAGVGTAVSIEHTFMHLKSEGFGSYMALLQIISLT